MGCCPAFNYHRLHDSWCSKWTKETAFVLQPTTLPKKVYLAGNIKGCSDEECYAWRSEAKRQLGPIPTEDPMDRDMRNVDNFDVHWLVRGDKAAIDRCSHLIAHWIKPGAGTSMEIHYAWERGKRIAFVNKAPESVSPWIRAHVDFVTDSLDEAVKWVIADRGHGGNQYGPGGGNL